MELLDTFARTLETTLPVFIMVFIGMGLRRVNWIDDAFVNTASALVFKATLPTLIFLSITRADLSTALNPGLLVFFLMATVGSFCLAWVWPQFRHYLAWAGVPCALSLFRYSQRKRTDWLWIEWL